MIYRSHGNRPGTIFCIHGNSSSSNVFRDLYKSNKISQTKFLVDLPGHGRNNQTHFDKDDFSFKSMKSFLHEHLYEIDDDILLVGNSLGGHLAIEIAPDVEKLKGLVIMGTPPVKKPLNFEEAFNATPELNSFFKEEVSSEELDAIVEIALINKVYNNIIINDFKKSNPKVRSTLANDIMSGSFDNQYAIFTSLTVPKFILAGDEDPTVNRDYLSDVCKASSFGCRVFDLDQCGHYPSIDCSDLFLQIISTNCQEVFRSD